MRSTEINCNHNVQNHLRSTATTLDEDNSSVFAKFWNFVLQTAQNQQNRSKIRKWKIFTRMEFWVIQSHPGMSRRCHAGVTQVSRDGIQILWSPSGFPSSTFGLIFAETATPKFIPVKVNSPVSFLPKLPLQSSFLPKLPLQSSSQVS